MPARFQPTRAGDYDSEAEKGGCGWLWNSGDRNEIDRKLAIASVDKAGAVDDQPLDVRVITPNADEYRRTVCRTGCHAMPLKAAQQCPASIECLNCGSERAVIPLLDLHSNAGKRLVEKEGDWR